MPVPRGSPPFNGANTDPTGDCLDLRNHLRIIGAQAVYGATRASAGVPATFRTPVCCIFTVSITKILCCCGAIA